MYKSMALWFNTSDKWKPQSITKMDLMKHIHLQKKFEKNGGSGYSRAAEVEDVQAASCSAALAAFKSTERSSSCIASA